MEYEEIAKAAFTLGYRDKLKLAQELIQLARREEEDKSPAVQPVDLGYISERVLKSKPSKYINLQNFIKAMYQFQGGISDDDVEMSIEAMRRKKLLSIENNAVTYSFINAPGKTK